VATTLAVDPHRRDRLRPFGHAAQSFDDILQALMDQVERERFVEHMHRVADDPETVWVDEADVDWD
jgi:hypothetical protein